ncbi:IMV membrane protein [NY_014 poxvirus]|uniref:IMV membrane protein n=1 Tax=NY_014 poxvirus TaxID=2025360 RepID=UPI000B99FB04|nr:IMV membrane protein [NY_014 poxvirus]AST09493.1 IMV membrane protein [NY_014 poxvirus]
MDKTTLSVNAHNLEYVREKAIQGVQAAKTSTIIFFVIILAISALLLWFQTSDNQIFNELSRYMRIKNTVRDWRSLTDSKTKLESDRGRLLSAGRDELFDFQCIDFGTYFSAVRLDKKTFLPQAIRRGTGDAWMIKKAAKIDLSAQQFCQYLIKHHSDNIITCGNEMLNELGYSGYFMDPHWCTDFGHMYIIK